jgi:sulfite reductase (NADPH) flavoprotein alpha-component
MNKAPVIPENAPFDAAQRLWLNGFLAGLFAGAASLDVYSRSASRTDQPVPLLVVFGSQTGTAEALARRIAAEANRREFKSRVLEAAAATSLDWSGEKHLLVVISTYGDGDMPDNAKAFWDWLQTDAAKALAHLRYAVLALGDTNYEQFCAAGKKVDQRLAEIGATRVHPRTDCDVDYETAAKAWMEGALSSLNTGAVAESPELKTATALAEASSPARTQAYSRTNPFPARLLTNQMLTGAGSGKEVRHVQISLENSGLVYEAGDALGVRPTNCPTLVSELLEVLGCDGEEAVRIPSGEEMSLRKALGDFYDITKPSQDLLKAVAENALNVRTLLAPEAKEQLKGWLRGRDVIDVLLEARQLKFTPDQFAGFLKPLSPRLYSISSSPKAHLGQVHLTVGIVRHEAHGRSRKGVCSTFLADRVIDSATVPVFVQTSHGFRLPQSGDVPIIMVGPGTGIAPFRAFLHERQATGAKGRNWLFFGEQHAASHFYYRDELQAMLQSGHLTRLSTAFSRDQADKVYVQNRMLEEAVALWDWLQAGAHFYVCGDAQRMARDVEVALHRVIETAGGRNQEEAQAFVQQMRTEKRYQRDVY